MTTRKPASLDGSLLARKGSAVPAVPLDSPLTEELGEPRPQATVLPFDSAAGDAAPQPAASGPTMPAAPGAAMPSYPARRSARIALALLGIAVLAALLFALVKLVPTQDRAASLPAATPSAAAVERQDEPTSNGTDAAPPAPETAAAAVAPVHVAGVAPKVPASAGEADPPVPVASTPDPAMETAPPPRVAAVISAPVPTRKPDHVPSRAAPAPYAVQLGSLPTQSAARVETDRLEQRLGNLLGGNRILTVRATGADRQTVFRLRVGGYASLTAARTACKRIRQQKVDCLVVRR